MSSKLYSKSNPQFMAIWVLRPSSNWCERCTLASHFAFTICSTYSAFCSLARNQLTTSLSALSTTASTLPIDLPPEIIDYIDQGRNPDIYTRELVEAVQRNNQYLKGKSEAFAGFRDMLAEEIIKAIPDSKGEVERILESRVQSGEVAELAKVNGDAAGETVGR